MSHRNRSVTWGLDVSDQWTEICRLDEDGSLRHERVRTRPAAYRERFLTEPPAQVVLEAGTHSPWITWLLAELGHEVVVAQPRRLRLITESVNKTDRRDAEWLARLGRSDLKLVAPIHVRPRAAQADLSRLRARDSLVSVRTALINTVRGLTKPCGIHLPGCSAEAFAKRVAALIPEDLAPALQPLLAEIESLTARIRSMERGLAQLSAERYPATERLRQVKGVGPITALAYVLTLDDPRRFARSREVGPYLGLTPRRAASGERDPQLRITRAGDHQLRRLLVLAAHCILNRGPECDLKRLGQQLVARGGRHAKKRAVVAVARKLAVLLHRLWVSGKAYQPLRRAAPASAAA